MNYGFRNFTRSKAAMFIILIIPALVAVLRCGASRVYGLRNFTNSSATMFIILIIGLIAGPAVSL